MDRVESAYSPAIPSGRWRIFLAFATKHVKTCCCFSKESASTSHRRDHFAHTARAHPTSDSHFLLTPLHGSHPPPSGVARARQNMKLDRFYGVAYNAGGFKMITNRVVWTVLYNTRVNVVYAGTLFPGADDWNGANKLSSRRPRLSIPFACTPITYYSTVCPAAAAWLRGERGSCDGPKVQCGVAHGADDWRDERKRREIRTVVLWRRETGDRD